MKNFLRSFLAGVMLLSLGGVSVAGDFTLDPSFLGCANCTPVSNVFGFQFLGTSFVQYTSGSGLGATDPFNDYGALVASQLLSADSTPLPSALNLFTGTGWQLGAVFSITGANTAVTGQNVNFAFTPGGTIKIYADSGLAMTPNDPASVSSGTLVAELTLVSGLGSFDFAAQDGNIDLVLEFTSLPVAGFWNYLGQPVDLGTQIFLSLTDSNNNLIACTSGTQTAFNSFFGITTGCSAPQQFFVSNDGSVKLQVSSVPEPGSLILLGFGLLGTVAVARRRSRKTK